MRIRIRTRTQLATATALLAAVLAVPGVALAADALPDVIDDPVAAAEPEIELDAPVAEPEAGPAPVPTPVIEAAAAGPTGTAADGPSSVPAAPVYSGGGSLPFTGPADGQLLLLLIVGSLSVSAGLVALAYATARPLVEPS